MLLEYPVVYALEAGDISLRLHTNLSRKDVHLWDEAQDWTPLATCLTDVDLHLITVRLQNVPTISSPHTWIAFSIPHALPQGEALLLETRAWLATLQLRFSRDKVQVVIENKTVHMDRVAL
ncbi:hypothetical protein MVES1_002052 [Malassezia vespertilionis]|nr:uncharacterized protein MVES1_002052 [Malassezia vespertilionis]WFD06698.1 hypothetical protein MVES1_002052 [Malassezia vespertilionis]